MNREQVIAANAGTPGTVELNHSSVFEKEHGVGRIIGRAVKRGAIFGSAFRKICCTVGNKTLHGAEYIIDHIAPVAEHINHHAPPILGTVVPTRALGGLIIVHSCKYPIPEVALNGQNFPEEALSLEHL